MFNYKYRFFILEGDVLENNYFFLHQIDLDLGNGEPIGLKIVKIPKIKKNKENDEPSNYDKNTDRQTKKNQQWFFIFCFLSNQRLFQLVTNYNRLSLYEVLRLINQCRTTSVPNSNSNKCSMTIIGYYNKDVSKIKQDNNLAERLSENDI